ncbi:MAG: carbohydrate kinase family protein [Steroidobacteraceae bacterium]|nr:carbohydrate kinase family protein [Nevskiaceae bacterium]MCP5339434.1 carbohydrate kinase family protein [Nevskiaceae bacterium]MCP5360547.1 carbohydrate kinase family protein [Nevskiaceae bacterium]MCP5472894.1 carbohydrate kinase family protein [Nevskiaceae bacterium]
MTALICGSVAYDTVMVFDGRFKDHILADRIHMLNVAFLVPALRRNFGGCAGNIAYNLKMIGGQGKVMATVGSDFAPYRAWMKDCGLPLDTIREIADEYTAQAYITTDADNNQITAFHPGAMNHAHVNHVPKDAGIRLGIVAPENRDGMQLHAQQFAAAGIPFIFDPGQGMTQFNGEELARFIEQATWVAANDYEASLLCERTGRSLEQIAAKVRALIVTRGGEGSHIYADGHRHEIPAAKPRQVNDPTGCGDAYRAGLLYGLQKDLDWPTTGRIASLLGAIKIEQHGTQNHRFSSDEFARRYRESFGVSLP